MPLTKQEILSAAKELFIEKGYDDVSMREIASALGISVGNLTYHYPRKEEILMGIHDEVMEEYQSQLSDSWKKKMGLTGYFASEYAFHYYIIHNKGFYRIYTQVINSPAMRADYYNRHLALYRSFVSDPKEEKYLYEATVITSSLEFQLMESGAIPDHFDESFRRIFKARLVFMDKDPEDYNKTIEKGIKEGKKLSKRINGSF